MQQSLDVATEAVHLRVVASGQQRLDLVGDEDVQQALVGYPVGAAGQATQGD